jgi:hypothetical protein
MYWLEETKTHVDYGPIERTLTNKARKDTQIRFYKVMATPVLLYGSETWPLNIGDKKGD